ncbi:hypothetical protein PWR63_11600 [Paraburkholderia sp. A2WS-5]|uniref:hypothetical protein n=1 Tax=unclassified Paraburkholderia TaxID=2615204 RepID=UPI003B80D493
MKKTKRRMCRAPRCMCRDLSIAQDHKTRRAGRQPPLAGLELIRHFTLAGKFLLIIISDNLITLGH